MEIEDIVATIFRLSTHWDLRRAPAVCRLWRDVYYKKKMVMGWESFKLGDVYGIYRTPYFPFEAYYLAAVGGHYEITKYFATRYPMNGHTLSGTFINSLMKLRCSPEILSFVPKYEHNDIHESAYYEGHIDFIRTIEPDPRKQIIGVLAHSAFPSEVLTEFFDSEYVKPIIEEEAYPRCICRITGKKTADHNIFCEMDKICAGKTPSTMNYSRFPMSPKYPMAVNEFIYNVLRFDRMSISTSTHGYDDSIDFIIRKLLEHEADAKKFQIVLHVSFNSFPEYVIKIYENVPSHKKLITDWEILEESMQGIEYMESKGMVPKLDNRVKSMMESQ